MIDGRIEEERNRDSETIATEKSKFDLKDETKLNAIGGSCSRKKKSGVAC